MSEIYLTKKNRAALEEVLRQDGEVSCSSFARGLWNNFRAAYAAGRVLYRLMEKGLLTRETHWAGSAHSVHYRITDLGRQLFRWDCPKCQRGELQGADRGSAALICDKCKHIVEPR